MHAYRVKQSYDLAANGTLTIPTGVWAVRVMDIIPAPSTTSTTPTTSATVRVKLGRDTGPGVLVTSEYPAFFQLQAGETLSVDGAANVCLLTR